MTNIQKKHLIALPLPPDGGQRTPGSLGFDFGISLGFGAWDLGFPPILAGLTHRQKTPSPCKIPSHLIHRRIWVANGFMLNGKSPG